MSRERDRATSLGLIHEQAARKIRLDPPSPPRRKRPALLMRIWRRLFAAKTWPACRTGPCEGGRKVCPSPEACRMSARDDS